jgi:hypothetical protein
LSAERFRIRDGHPRVLITPDDLPILRRRAATTHAAQMQSLLALADAAARAATETTPSVRPVPASGGDYADPVWRLAFLHLLTSNPAHANAAISLLRKLLDLPVSGEYFVGARRLKAFAACYDWLHASLGDELRDRVGRTALDYCQALYDSGEVEPDCFFLGHAINQMPFILMAAIAVGDEIDDGTRSRHFIADVLDRWQKQMLCYRRFLEQDCFQQSMSYSCTYVGEFPYLFNAIEAGLTSVGSVEPSIEMYRSHAWFANVTQWWTYGMRDDASFLRFGDYFCAIPALENAQYFRALSSIATRRVDRWIASFRTSGTSSTRSMLLTAMQSRSPSWV